ncbi:MAG: M67 family metallopeptidase [Chloroflexi bacterium]|nr:M67 family metallopeptidase [Chloroflexota bacterium]
MIAHAREEKPHEACGLLAGVNGRVIKHYRGTNADQNRRVRYSMDPLEQLRAMKEIDDNDWQLLAIYHSHPHSPAYPSPTDVQLAFYPDSIYVIISLADPERPVVKAFRIVDGIISEEGIEVR